MEVVFYITYLFTALYIAYVIYILIGWFRISPYKNENTRNRAFETQISVIIPTRNEENNIVVAVNDILSQDYPNHLYEVIVVDDHSEDTTLSILNKARSKNIKIIKLSDHLLDNEAIISYKKKAIEIGIANASGNLIVTTDADCRFGKRWLSAIAGYYEEYKPVMIVGPIIIYEYNSFFDRFQALEMIALVATSAGLIGNKNPVLCSGANLAYEKKVFNELNGFEGIDDISTGDDVLLLQKFSNKYKNKIGFLKSLSATVHTKPQDGYLAFVQQRIRWGSKAKKVKNIRLTLLALIIFVFNLTLIFNFGLIFFKYKVYLELFFNQFIVKCLIDILLIFVVSKFFKQNKLLWLFLPIQIMYVWYIFFVGILSNISNYKWKGRSYR